MPKQKQKQQLQLLIGSQARTSRRQHTTPCSDCPFRRTSLAGWVGSLSPARWIEIIIGEGYVHCHTLIGPPPASSPRHCAGAAIFRTNICKELRDPASFKLPGNIRTVFHTIAEFLTHHRDNPKGRSWL